MNPDIRKLVDATPLADTHEHLLEEQERICPTGHAPNPGVELKDIGMFFSHYSDSDLRSSGMPEAEHAKVMDASVSPTDKWKLVKPYYERTRNTAYLRNVRESLRILYGEEDLHDGNVESVSEKIRETIRPGYYRHILKDVCNLTFCEVNSLQDPVFMETAHPDLLCQDIKLNGLADINGLAQRQKCEIGTLAQWHATIDDVFHHCGPRAIALKTSAAYVRPLNFAEVSAEEAARLMERRAKGTGLTRDEYYALDNHIFHYCVRKAKEYHLPVRIHTGYLANVGNMQLHHLRHHGGDMCDIVRAHPDVNFILMHITYPYQDEAIAIAKHHPNAYVDMCWAWIVAPTACVRFVKDFILAAPHNKLLTFGGDYMPVEMVPGHVSVARQGLAQALSELLEEHWINETDVEALTKDIMYRNADALFDYEGTLAQWKR